MFESIAVFGMIARVLPECCQSTLEFDCRSGHATRVFQLPFNNLIDQPDGVVVGDAGQQRILGAALDQLAAVNGQTSWEPPALRTWQQRLRQAYEIRSAASSAVHEYDFVLSADQELALWQRVIREDAGFDSPATEQTARAAQGAWRICHSWALPAPNPHSDSQDCAAFARWSKAFGEYCRRLRVHDSVSLLTEAQANPDAAPVAAVHGLFEVPPVVRDWLEASGRIIQPVPRGETSRFQGHRFADRRQEYRAAASWAAAQMTTDPAARIAVVAPNSDWQESELQNVLDEYFGPADSAPVCWAEPHQTLHNRPLLRLAMCLLGLNPVPRWDLLSELLIHPLLDGADEEWSARARLDDDLRGFERFELPLAFVSNRMSELDSCPRLQQIITRLTREIEAQPERQSMSQWFAHFDACLKAARWPGDSLREPGQIEAYEFWQQCCDRLATLDAVTVTVNRNTALARLHAALQTPYTGSATASQVFVCSTAQALALQPTAVWVLGCESEHLPLTPRLSPLLPIAAQREAGVPGSDPKQSLWLTRVLLEGLAHCATECQASFIQADGDVPYTPSPLIPALANAAPARAHALVPEKWRGHACEMETVVDEYAKPLASGTNISGGVTTLMLHNACPFRGFSRSRLQAGRLSVPTPGISFRHKGIFVHRVLAAIWEQLKDQQTLQSMSETERSEVVALAIDHNLVRLPFETDLERALHFIERDRLAQLVECWLQFECERPAFEVIGTEQQYRAEIADLVLTTRIDRVDRIEQQATQIIDYKTGACSVSGWIAPRMDDPQLPFYAQTAPTERVDSVAFAAVDVADPRWHDWRPEKTSELAPDEQWSQQRQQWAVDLEQTVGEIGAGLARVAPKYGDQTCQRCEHALICRRAERVRDANGDEDD